MGHVTGLAGDVDTFADNTVVDPAAEGVSGLLGGGMPASMLVCMDYNLLDKQRVIA